MKLFFTLIFCFICLLGSANDGAFFARGNQLIPIQQTDIAIKKEMLYLRKEMDKFISVTVDYEFFNPGAEKQLLIGFEAMSPSGDVDNKPINGKHPNMRNFTAEINGVQLPFEVTIVKDSNYYEGGKFKSISAEKASEENDDSEENSFYYVYYFKATFKPGVNKIIHTYQYDLNADVLHSYTFDYVLSAANRWANHEIEDFTLIMDMGLFEEFKVLNTFFKKPNQWNILGIGKTSIDQEEKEEGEQEGTNFAIQQGLLIFKKQHFVPKSELYVLGLRPPVTSTWSASSQLPFSINQQNLIPRPNDELGKKILKNLPFARRGFVFQTPELKKFYENQSWYIKNPGYEANRDYLTLEEKDWIDKFGK